MSTQMIHRIRHNPSRFATDPKALPCPIFPKKPNPAQSVTPFCDGSVKDLRGPKPYKNKEKLSLYVNTSRCHAYPRAMRVHAYEGGVTDLFARLGTSGAEFFRDARGNSRAIEHSLFCWSEFQGGNYEGHIATDYGNQALRTQPAN